jgi:hypothetical protein
VAVTGWPPQAGQEVHRKAALHSTAFQRRAGCDRSQTHRALGSIVYRVGRPGPLLVVLRLLAGLALAAKEGTRLPLLLLHRPQCKLGA